MSPYILLPTRTFLCVVLTTLSSSLVQADNGSLVRTSGFTLSSQSEHSADTANQSRLAESSDLASSSLNLPLKGAKTSSESKSEQTFGSQLGSLGTTIGALVVTLGLFALFVAFTRRMQKNQLPKSLPREAFEVIGETELGPKQKLIVVRCGLQALVVGVSPAGIQPVAQIDDPDEAGQFIAQCRGLGSSAVFSSTLKEIEKEPVRPGFVDESAASRGKGKLFLRA